MSLRNYLIGYISKNPVGFLKNAIMPYMKENKLPSSALDEILIKANEILREIGCEYYSSNEMYELNKSSNIYDENILLKLKYHISRFDAIIIGLKEDQFLEISQELIRNNFRLFKINDIVNLNGKIEINCHYDNVDTLITISCKRIKIESEYAKKIEMIYPFFEYLKYEGDFGEMQKAYLPLDTVTFLSFNFILKLLKERFNGIAVLPTNFSQSK